MKFNVTTGALLILLATAQAAEQPKDICKTDGQTQAAEQIKKECALSADPSACEKQAKALYDALVDIHCARPSKEHQ